MGGTSALSASIAEAGKCWKVLESAKSNLADQLDQLFVVLLFRIFDIIDTAPTQITLDISEIFERMANFQAFYPLDNLSWSWILHLWWFPAWRRCCRSSLSGGGPRSQGPKVPRFGICEITAMAMSPGVELVDSPAIYSRFQWETMINQKIVGFSQHFRTQCWQLMQLRRLRLQFLFLPPSGLICRSGTKICKAVNHGGWGVPGACRVLWGLPPQYLCPTFFNEWCRRLKVWVPCGAAVVENMAGQQDHRMFFYM